MKFPSSLPTIGLCWVLAAMGCAKKQPSNEISSTLSLSHSSRLATSHTAIATPTSPSERNLSWRRRQTLRAQSDVLTLAFSPDGKTLASGSARYDVTYDNDDPKTTYYGGAIQLWDAHSGALRRTITIQKLPVLDIAFDSNGATLATANFKEIRLWDVRTGELRHILNTPSGQIAISPDGKLLVSAQRQNVTGAKNHETYGLLTLRLWELPGGKLIRTSTVRCEQFYIDAGDVGVTVAFVPNSNTVTTTDSTEILRLWDIQTGRCVKTIPDFGSQLVFSNNGQRGLTMDFWVLGPMTVCTQLNLQDTRTWKLQKSLTPQEFDEGYNDARDAAFSPDSKMIVGAVDRALRFWDARSGKLLRQEERPFHPFSVVFAPDGRAFATGGDKFIEIWRG